MNPVCATAILGFSLWENALQLFYKVEGETLNLKQISCSFVLFFSHEIVTTGQCFLNVVLYTMCLNISHCVL